jgi:hypothetical protein
MCGNREKEKKEKKKSEVLNRMSFDHIFCLKIKRLLRRFQCWPGS